MVCAGTGPNPVSSGIPPSETELTQELYLVPSHAAWFAYDDIHDKERISAPEFFNNKAQSKTPKVLACCLQASLLSLRMRALIHCACMESLTDLTDLQQRSPGLTCHKR